MANNNINNDLFSQIFKVMADTTVTEGSNNLVTSGAVKQYVDSKIQQSSTASTPEQNWDEIYIRITNENIDIISENPMNITAQYVLSEEEANLIQDSICFTKDVWLIMEILNPSFTIIEDCFPVRIKHNLYGLSHRDGVFLLQNSIDYLDQDWNRPIIISVYFIDDLANSTNSLLINVKELVNNNTDTAWINEALSNI